MYDRDGFFPRKGRIATDDSLVTLSVGQARPHVAQRIAFVDDTDGEGLVAIARPIIARGIAMQASLLVLREQDSGLLQPQIDRVKPIFMDRFYRHL